MFRNSQIAAAGMRLNNRWRLKGVKMSDEQQKSIRRIEEVRRQSVRSETGESFLDSSFQIDEFERPAACQSLFLRDAEMQA